MNQDQTLQAVVPWKYEPIAQHDLDAEAAAYLKGYTAHPQAGQDASYRLMRRRLIVTWMLSYGNRTKYVRAIARAADINVQQCQRHYERAIYAAWVAYQEKESHSAEHRRCHSRKV